MAGKPAAGVEARANGSDGGGGSGGRPGRKLSLQNTSSAAGFKGKSRLRPGVGGGE
jgi:hypothetical protein